MKKKLKAASFFVGVGGIDLGFIQNNVEVIYANELDKYAVYVYEENHNIKVDHRDIRQVQVDEIPDFDILLGGFPCQAFSTEGRRQGFNDEKNRGTLVYELFRILKAKHPRAFFFENVRGLVHHDQGRTLSIILNELKKLKYHVSFAIMNAKDYGNVPQNRDRIYIVGFKDARIFRKFEFPEPIKLTNTLSKVINFNQKVENRYYFSSSRYKKIFEGFKKCMDNSYSVYRHKYGRYEKKANNICFCLVASMAGPSIPAIKSKFGIRSLTPEECFRLQGFPSDFIIPKYVSNTQLYKQAGNSVCVSVISRIAKKMVSALSY